MLGEVMTNVFIAGAGPAALALAAACRARSLTVQLTAPDPYRRWQATYGMWSHQWEAACRALPTLATVPVRATRNPGLLSPSRGRLVRGRIAMSYVVADTSALQAALWEAAEGLMTADTTISTEALAQRRHLPGVGPETRVVDARGAVPPDLRGPRGRRDRRHPAQSAFGYSFSDSAVAAMLDGEDGRLMDWRPAPLGGAETATTRQRPSFLYVVRLPGGLTLCEETDLAGAPALPIAVLRERLEARLRRHGVDTAAVAGSEKVHFPLVAAPRPEGVECFGTAAGAGHPATGYSAAAALTGAATAAQALAAGAPLPAPYHRVTAIAHTAGLRALLGLSARDTREMFAAFGALAPGRQQAFFDRGAAPAPTIGAMAGQWWKTPTATRFQVAAAVVRGVPGARG